MTTTSRLPPWVPAHQIPKRAIPHAIVQIRDGSIAPGKYSDLNRIWWAWDGAQHVVADVLRYIDLGLLIPKAPDRGRA